MLQHSVELANQCPLAATLPPLWQKCFMWQIEYEYMLAQGGTAEQSKLLRRSCELTLARKPVGSATCVNQNGITAALLPTQTTLAAPKGCDLGSV